jgi:hypothetical protein
MLVARAIFRIISLYKFIFISLQLPIILFTDWIQFNFSLSAARVTTPEANSAFGLETITLGRILCQMTSLASPTTNHPNSSTAYYHCGDFGAVDYIVKPTGQS